MHLLALVLTLTLEQQHAVRMLTDAAFRGDTVGTELARKRAGDGSEARMQYYVAFSEWMDAQTVGGDAAAATAKAKQAMASVDRAIGLDPKLVEAHVLRSRIVFLLMFHGAMPFDEARASMTESFTNAKKLAPEHPLVTSLEAAFVYYGGNGREKGRALLRQSIDRMAASDDESSKLWLPVVWSWYGVMLLGEAEMEQARTAFESALAARPDYEYVKSAMLPMTDLVEAGTLPKFSRTGWKPVVSDEEGDGKSKSMPDLRNVAWRADGDRVWFLFSLAAAPDPSRIGMNLAMDLDGDPDNGPNWWAGNRGFRYDRLVTVWVARGKDGKYRGSVGVADAADIVAERFTTSPAGTVSFAVDAENEALLVGVKRSALVDQMRVVATVGSNTDWNDVAPGEGSALLDLD
ncbi:MAG TPA: hypothetical protein VGQ36_06710 [Thermoanaerobaculia bacterium]|jgi:hypothetical protein|nr:hypothetical protein [Thermoanaerobaculia bacterium]